MVYASPVAPKCLFYQGILSDRRPDPELSTNRINPQSRRITDASTFRIALKSRLNALVSLFLLDTQGIINASFSWNSP